MKNNCLIKGIHLDKSGKVYNITTGKLLKISKRGYFNFDNKIFNLPKLMLESFQNIPTRNGRVIFKDGNRTNFNIENLEYQTKLAPTEKPQDEDILNVINFYFVHDPLKNLNNVFKYRMHLSIILRKRDFFTHYKNEKNLNVFKDYSGVFAPGYYSLSKIHNISVLESKRTIFYFLNKLIEDCKKDGFILKQAK